MTTAPVPPVPILDLLGQRNLDAAHKRERERAEASSLYWTICDRLAAGDPTGGTDPATLGALLDALGLDLAAVKGDVTAIQGVRAAEANHDAAEKQVAEMQTAHQTAFDIENAVKAELEKAQQETRAAQWRAADSQDAKERARAALAAARKTAATLEARGCKAVLVRPLPPPPPLMARYIGKSPRVLWGILRAPGDVLTAPPGTPLQPVHDLIPADQPWPPAKRKRRFVALADMRSVGLGGSEGFGGGFGSWHSKGSTFVVEIADGTPLPWSMRELPLDEPEPPAAVPAQGEPVAEVDTNHPEPAAAAAAAVAADTSTSLDELLEDLEEQQP